ncbi:MULTISPECIES: PKD domain-containing protein [unclassified Pseudoalteromonas]|uniref:PKD domain-containing protein n=1 Tax=unclassified Pseudoalteromonas TaxID=194690 RepID=UPI002096F59E|nr:PKD domain-containing protein [Pseudoalteromonas sp. XMcav2-N]MCO7188757.1 PKD domain-containing protein [Pseudoalteromonas sp. XMcav2-N]
MQFATKSVVVAVLSAVTVNVSLASTLKLQTTSNPFNVVDSQDLTPKAQSTYITSFETSDFPDWIQLPADSPWVRTQSQSSDGAWSLRSASLNAGESSTFKIQGEFKPGFLVYDFRLQTSGTDNFRITYNNTQVKTHNSDIQQFWLSDSFQFTGSGYAELEFSLTAPQGQFNTDVAWVDNILFIGEDDLRDTDGDGLPDYWELKYGLNRNSNQDFDTDPDGDGLTALQEYQLGTNPKHSDSDNDQMGDYYEVENNLDPTSAHDATLDNDTDGYTNLQEYFAVSDPNDSTSVAPTYTSFFENFSSPERPSWLRELADNITPWYVVPGQPKGCFRVRTHWSPGARTSGFAIAGEFNGGTIWFQSWIYQTRNFVVYVNDIETLRVNNREHFAGSLQKVDIPEGFNVIKFVVDGNPSNSPITSMCVTNLQYFQEVPLEQDSDEDGVPDYYELMHGMNGVVDDSAEDFDRDGVSNLIEFQIGSNPNSEDSDLDGIPDSEDAHPADPDKGENQAPVFGELEPLFIEATYEVTNIIEAAGPLVNVTDNGNLPVKLWVEGESQLGLGQHKVTWIAVDHVGNKSSASQIITIADTTPPSLSDIGEWEAYNKTDLLTSLSGYYKDEIDKRNYQFEFYDDFEMRYGDVLLPLRVTDSAGNVQQAQIKAYLKPYLKLDDITYFDFNGDLTLKLEVLGQPKDIHTELRVKVGRKTVPLFTSRIWPYMYVTLPAGYLLDDAEIRIDRASGLGVTNGPVRSRLRYIEESNDMPVHMEITQLQNSEPVAVGVKNEHQVWFHIYFEDPNGNDVYTLTTEHELGTNGQLFRIEDHYWRFQFDPREVQSDAATVVFNASKKGQENTVHLSKQVTIKLIDAAPTFDDDSTDTDGDWVTDYEEGIRDIDGDRIVDYLDPYYNKTIAHLSDNTVVTSQDERNRVQLGLTKVIFSETTPVNMSLTSKELSDYAAHAGIYNPQDPYFLTYSDTANVMISLHPESDTAAITLPAKQGINDPALLVRAMTGTGWKTLGHKIDNTLQCEQCVGIEIKDGSEFDLDGKVNGQVEFIARTATSSNNRAPELVITVPDSIEELSSITLDASQSTDPDGDELTFSWTVRLPGAQITTDEDSAKAVLSVPELTQSETSTLIININDGFSTTDFAYDIEFLNVNKAPVIELSENLTANEGSNIKINAQVTDLDGDAITYLWTQTAGKNVELIDNTSATLSFVAPTVDTQTVLSFQLSASDGQLTVNEQINITIENKSTDGDTPDSNDGDDGSKTPDPAPDSGSGGALSLLFLILSTIVLTRRRAYSG